MFSLFLTLHTNKFRLLSASYILVSTVQTKCLKNYHELCFKLPLFEAVPLLFNVTFQNCSMIKCCDAVLIINLHKTMDDKKQKLFY